MVKPESVKKKGEVKKPKKRRRKQMQVLTGPGVFKGA